MLVILGVFAARLVEPEQFLRIVRKEQLLSADFIDYLVQELVEERTTRLQAQFEQELQALEARLQARIEEERQAKEEAERQVLKAERQALEVERQMREAERQAKEEAERQVLEAERQALEAEYQAHLHSEQEALEALVLLRFPDAPLRLITVMRQIRNLDRLRAVRSQVPTIADLATLEQALRVAAADEANGSPFLDA